MSALLPAVYIADYSNYNFVEGNYLQGEYSDFDAEGWRFNGSFKFTERAFVAAEYEELEIDESIPDLRLEGDKKQIGLVYKFTERFAGIANYNKESDDDTIGLGIRFYF